MSTWGRRKQTLIITYTIFLLVVSATAVYFLAIRHTPTCFDSIHNGHEDGIDCGGSCERVCSFSATTPNVLWARSLEVAKGLYNFAALVENPNFNVGAAIPYTFRAYNSDNILVKEIGNEVYLYPQEKRVIFEPLVSTDNKSVRRVFFEFGQHDGWYPLEAPAQVVTNVDHKLDQDSSQPALVAELYNSGVQAVRNMTVHAVLYNTEGNVEQVSQTYLEAIPPLGREEVFFSWRKPFTSPIERVEVFVIQEPA